MAHKSSAGTTKNGRDSNPKYLGVKLFDGQNAKTGNILVRQTGSKVWPGEGVRQGSDYTLYAAVDGTVRFSTRKKSAYTGARRAIKVVNVVPVQ